MIKTILLPIDGPDRKDSVLPHVAEIARRFEARVVILHALQPFSPLIQRPPLVLDTTLDTATMQVAAAESAAALEKAARELLAGIATQLARDGIETESVIRDGDPSRVIADVASEQNADLIAMSTHGRKGIGRVLLGSVADEVVRRSSIPVLLIRTEEKSD
jgi:nucleotide-binding universal stress UspA family protein